AMGRSSTGAAATATPGSGNSPNNDATTPPPPSSVTGAASTNGVPPTPAPATPGLPSSPATGVLPSQQGFDARTNNELRPSSSLNVDQVANVQAALASGGFFRGPIDGNLTASTRAAIRQFQNTNRLPETGDLDRETMQRLSTGVVGGVGGNNGNTSTTGNRGAAGDPFSTTFGGVPTSGFSTGQSGVGGPIFSTPFPISTPLNTSPGTPAGSTVQP
ncbi:MAG: putative peptidoglycan binding domain, partial [Myxococcales bacterium]|nr:putative peptidoglycan binding domain [Myxococcales bacterium]